MEKFNLEKNKSENERIEEGKNPGLGIFNLHKDGINGNGIHVAIIDQNLDREHSEYKNSICDFRVYGDSDKEEISMHGPSVVSILSGKSLGVAPGSLIHYFNIPGGGIPENIPEHVQSLKDIIEYNNSVVEELKIKIISLSAGIKESIKIKEWEEIKNEVRQRGVTLLDSSKYTQEHFGYMCGGAEQNKDNVDSYRFPDWIMKNKDFDEIKKNFIIVPSDYRTRASSWTGVRKYEYDKEGGLSWSIPYFAGILAMALQVNPKLTEKEFENIVKSSVIINKNGYKVINPQGIIEKAKNLI